MELDLVNRKPSYMWVFEQVPFRCKPEKVANILWWLSEKGYKAWLCIETGQFPVATSLQEVILRKRAGLVREAQILIARDRVNDLIKDW